MFQSYICICHAYNQFNDSHKKRTYITNYKISKILQELNQAFHLKLA